MKVDSDWFHLTVNSALLWLFQFNTIFVRWFWKDISHTITQLLPYPKRQILVLEICCLGSLQKIKSQSTCAEHCHTWVYTLYVICHPPPPSKNPWNIAFPTPANNPHGPANKSRTKISVKLCFFCSARLLQGTKLGDEDISKCLDTFSSWWLNQPIWKVCSSNWVHLPQF